MDTSPGYRRGRDKPVVPLAHDAAAFFKSCGSAVTWKSVKLNHSRFLTRANRSPKSAARPRRWSEPWCVPSNRSTLRRSRITQAASQFKNSLQPFCALRAPFASPATKYGAFRPLRPCSSQSPKKSSHLGAVVPWHMRIKSLQAIKFGLLRRTAFFLPFRQIINTPSSQPFGAYREAPVSHRIL